MEIYKIVAIGLICAFITVYLKGINSDLAMPASVCAGIILLSMTVSYISDFITIFQSLSLNSSVDESIFKIVIKIIAVSYLVEFSASSIEDFGLKNISDKVVFAGKILILTMSAPIIENLISTVLSLL